MVITKILNYKQHIRITFRPLIDFRLNFLKNGLNINEKHNLIVNLTTYGKRLKEVKYTLFSLFNQRLKPDRIILWLDKSLNEESTFKLLDSFVKAGLEIKFTMDIGPYTKLIPALKEFSNAILVTADDDIYYPPDWLEKLYNSYLTDREAIHCHRAHKIGFNTGKLLPYEKWDKQIMSTGYSGFDYFLTGVGGVLYPPNTFNSEVFNEDAFLKIAPKADDIWFWGMAVLNGTKIRIVKDNITYLKSTNIFRQLSGGGTLYSYNRNGGNDNQLNKLLENYPEIKKYLIDNKKLRLVYDASSIYPYKEKNGHRAGVFNVALNILNEFLKSSDIEITLYSDYKYYYFLKNIIDEYYPNLKLIDNRRFYEKIAGKLLYSLNSTSKKLFYLCLYILRCLELFFPENKKFIKIFSNYDVFFSPFGGIRKELLKSDISRYQFIHDVIPLLENRSISPYHWAKNVFANITNDIYYFTNSEYTKKDFLKMFPYINAERVTPVKLGCNLKKIKNTDIYTKYGIPENKKYFLSLCSIGKRKNLDFAIKDFLIFIKENNIDDMFFVIAGAVWNKYRQEITKYTNNSPNIILTGYIDDDDLPDLYSNAYAFVYPSLYEGFGLPPLEAMGYKCPVIASNRTSIPEVCGDAAILINPESDVSLINAYKTLYFDTNIRTIMIEKGYKQFQKFSWNKSAILIRTIIFSNK